MDNEMMRQVTLPWDGSDDDAETQLSGIDGVRDVEVNDDDNTVTVTYDPTVVSENQLIESLQGDGDVLPGDSALTDDTRTVGDEGRGVVGTTYDVDR